MPKFTITTILFVSLLFVFPAAADDVVLRSNSPDRHVVVPGDTLWGISSIFLENPWRWPQIWGLNEEQIKNPHRIYPGDIIVLEKTLKGLRLRLSEDKATVKLSPEIRMEDVSSAISSIPAADIEPFLSQPIVIDRHELKNAPYILGASDSRVLLDKGMTIYTTQLPEDEGSEWQIFRPGKALKDPDAGNEILGYQAVYLGDINIKVFDEVSTAMITRSVQGIQKGDRLVSAGDPVFNNYVPHAPDYPIEGRIISVYGGVSAIGQNSIITLNKGARNGLEIGHVLAVYRRSHASRLDKKIVQLPDERVGLIFIFRVFEKVAYALVVQSSKTIKLLDAVKSPQKY